MKKRVAKSLVVPVLLLSSCAGYAAQSVDLDTQSMAILKPYIIQPQHGLRGGAMPGPAGANSQDKVEEVSRNVDFNQTTHIRVQQTHAGYPVFGGEAVLHVAQPSLSKRSLTMLAGDSSAANTDMNGTIYQNLDADLQNTPSSVFTKEQADKALDQAVKLAQQKDAVGTPESKESKLMVFVDNNNKAHWAFLTTLYFPTSKAGRIPTGPHYILDAQTLQVYKEWNDVQSIEDDGLMARRPRAKPVLVEVDGGGLGGNVTHGKLVYDGLTGDLGKLTVERQASKKLCSLENSLAEVRSGKTLDANDNPMIVTYPCEVVSQEHHVYWDGGRDQVNGGYSPSNDALYAGSVVKSLYKDWYGHDMLTDRRGKALKLKLITHVDDSWENAVWDETKQQIYLGDGADRFHPLTSLGVIAHEVSHGYTQQHSGLIYEAQSGGLNESFSDMAAQAAEFYAYGKSSWQIGAELSKQQGDSLRYMDHPAKDCEGVTDGDCSIENVKDYTERLNVHYTSGIFNRVFYLIATAEGWDTRKAFDVMVQANTNYWTPTTNFKKAACGVLKAAKDHKFSPDAIKAAFTDVGIDTSDCK